MNKIKGLFRLFLLLILYCQSPGLNAQEDAVVLTIANDVSSTNWLEFDLMLYDPDPAQPFELSAVQAGILVNPQITGGGTVTALILEGTSSLNASQVPNSITYAPCESAIKLSSRPLPGCGLGTKISQDPDHRTRICRIRLANTLPFAPCSSADLAFCFTTTPFPTKLSYYPPDCVPVPVALSISNCYSTALNQPFNTGTPAPLSFLVSGGGAYCTGGIGVSVELSGSETNVAYRLYKDGVAQSPVVQGTGLPLYFGNQLSGIYTIEGYRSCGSVSVYTSLMTGSAIITVADSTVPGSVSGPDSVIEGITEVSLSLSGNNGDVLRWQKRLNGGTWSDIPATTFTYSEIPATAGTWEYRAKVQNSACPSVNSASWSVEVLSRTLTLKVYLQALFRESTGIMEKAQDENGDKFPGEIADQITLQLADDTAPYGTEFTISNLALMTDGEVTLPLPAGSSASYYLVIRHRNSLETWSAIPVNLGMAHAGYDLTDGLIKAYGNNMLMAGNTSLVFGGDVNQDGIVDSGDMIGIDNDASAFSSGYLLTDSNGDGLVDSGDMILVDNNVSQFITKVTP